MLKKRKQNAEARAARARALVLNKKKQQQTKQEIFKRAERYVREYKRREQDAVRLRRVARRTKNFFVPAQPSLAFVVRIRGYPFSSYIFTFSFNLLLNVFIEHSQH